MVSSPSRACLVVCQRADGSLGNLHINVVADKYDDEIEQVLEPYIYEVVCESISTNILTAVVEAESDGK